MKFHLPVRLFQSLLLCLSVACFTVNSGVVMAEEQASIILGEQDTLTIDYADAETLPDVGGILQLLGGTQLNLSNCGEGDGKTYTLATGVSALLDAEGNELLLDSSNNTISHYFDTTQPGTGFWADATLSLSEDGILQLVRHHETVKAAQTITTRQTASLVFSYYEEISFEDITGSSSGGAIYGGSNSTIELSGNGSVEFSGNTASSGGGGAIYGYDGSTIELSGNGSVEFSGNTASSTGGAIRGGSNSTIELSGDGSVTFSGNTASHGGAIEGSTIELSGNGSVTFSGNTASNFGGAIHGITITLSDNGSVTFSGNTASTGGAIIGYGNLSILNNDSVLFEKNAEIFGETYILRSIRAVESGAVISLSAAAGKSIEFRDSVYITSGSTVNLNADYTDANGVVHKQTGDIIFTGKYTEQHLNELLAADGLSRTATEEEILNSRTTEVYAMTNLYGGRLCVEDGAVYEGYGITAHEGSSATVLVKDATLNHAGYDLVFNAGTTLELAGENTLYGDVSMLEGSHFSVSIEKPNADYIFGRLQLGGDVSLSLSDSVMGENAILLYVSGGIAGWNEDNITLLSNTVGSDDLTWVGNMLVLNHNADTFNRYFNGEYSTSKQLIGNVGLVCYTGISFENISGGAIYGYGSTIVLNGNGSVEFSGNTMDSYFGGGAIHGGYNSTIELSGNDSVTFSGNRADGYGGAIYGSMITLSGNDSVTFSGNTADDRGGAIYGGTITLSGNGSVTFIGNRASSGGAIYGGTIELSGNDSVEFSGNTTASSSGGAIAGGTITLSGNGSVTFIGNRASSSGGAIYGGTIELGGNGSVTFSGNRASYEGGAISGYGNLNIRNNDSVLFEKNAEERNETYRLRSIYAGGSGDVISLSAAAGKSIEFRDSVYIASGSTVNLNADYTDANGLVHKQAGDIIFTGAYTEQHLNKLLEADGLNRTATEAEILNSRTTEVHTMTNLYGGRLRVEDKAVLKLNGGLTVAEGGNASVEVKAAELNVGSHALSMVSGSSLALADGAKVTATELTITTGATLAVLGSVSTEPLTEQVAALTLSKETVAGFDASRAVNMGPVSVLEGDLTLESGSLLSLDDAYLELSGNLFFDVAEGEEKIALDIAPGVITDENNQVVLFNVNGVVTFGFDGLTASADNGMVYCVKAEDYFTGNRVTESMKLVYDSSTGMVYLENAAGAVPEPTTTTLSLLALAALAARRRRK